MPETQVLKFGVLVYPDGGLPDIPRQFRWLEDLGFDQVLVPDHSADLRNRGGPWFDGWSLLPIAAHTTDRIRIGTLVSNPILRPPATLARQALTVDHLSGGRLDLGIGAGIFDWDHHAVGEEPWSPRERAGRFADYTAIVDGILSGTGDPLTYEGQWLHARDVATSPGSIQRPRPTIITGGQSPTVLRVSAERADVWNTHGPSSAILWRFSKQRPARTGISMSFAWRSAATRIHFAAPSPVSVHSMSGRAKYLWSRLWNGSTRSA